MIRVSTVYRPIPETTNVKVSRKQSVLGNPFYMANESMRDEVCDKFEAYFNTEIKKVGSDFHMEMVRLYKIAKQHDLTLQCHCHPKRCHADTIKNFLDSMLSK